MSVEGWELKLLSVHIVNMWNELPFKNDHCGVFQ